MSTCQLYLKFNRAIGLCSFSHLKQTVDNQTKLHLYLIIMFKSVLFLGDLLSSYSWLFMVAIDLELEFFFIILV